MEGSQGGRTVAHAATLALTSRIAFDSVFGLAVVSLTG
jgi:hypothetical protein